MHLGHPLIVQAAEEEIMAEFFRRHIFTDGCEDELSRFGGFGDRYSMINEMLDAAYAIMCDYNREPTTTLELRMSRAYLKSQDNHGKNYKQMQDQYRKLQKEFADYVRKADREVYEPVVQK